MPTTTPTSVINLALALPESDRLHIASELLASVKPPGVLSVEDLGFAEQIRRRCAAIDAGTADLVDYDAAMARIRSVLSSKRQSGRR
jgi:hypothetical protein